MKLFGKIYSAVFISFVAAIALISYVTTVKQISDAEHRTIDQHRIIGSLISKDIERGHIESKWPFESLKRLSNHHDFLFWWIIDDNGRIHLADKSSLMGSHARDYLPELATLSSNNGVVLNRQRNYGVFIRQFGIGKRKWAFCLAFSTKDIAQARRRITLSVTLFSISGLAALGLILYFIIKHFTKPVESLEEGVRQIGMGRFDHRVHVHSQDELGYLSQSFNKMAEHLQTSTTSIENLNREVAQRKQAKQRILRQSALLDSINRVFRETLTCETAEEVAETALAVAEELTASKFGLIGRVNQSQRFDTIAMSDTGWDACRMPRSQAVRVIKDMEVRGIWGRVIKSGQSLITNAPASHPDSVGIPNGHPHVSSFLGVPLKDGDRTMGMIAVANKEGGYDPEDQRALERLSVALVEALKRKWAEERQTELLKQIETANRELKDFAYVVSHDLRAPLRGIRTLTCWISTDYADKLDDQGKEQINLLAGRVDRMNNLIEGILEYSRVGRVKEERVQVNLNQLVPELIDLLAPPENISITVEDRLPTVECEKTRIGQVFQNLLGNAVKFMDKPQGQITIGCAEEDGFWKFSVADNGPGIEKKYFDKIFQIFQTLVPRDEFESTGIGLTVVKKIIDLNNGAIWVESEPGQGTTFFFTLPKQETKVEHEKQQAHIAT